MDLTDAAWLWDSARAGLPVKPRAVAVPADYHVHTCWSDGEGTAGELVARAVDLGLAEVGLADHLVPYDPDDDYGIPHQRLGDYAAAVREAAAAARSRILVLTAVEVDYAPQSWAQMLALAAGQSFDYVIGSVHAVDGMAVDYIEDKVLQDWPDKDELFTRYYATVAEMAATGAIDVVGHLDLPKKFGRRPSPAVRRAEDAALDADRRGRRAVEVNTSGLRFSCAESVPVGGAAGAGAAAGHRHHLRLRCPRAGRGGGAASTPPWRWRAPPGTRRVVRLSDRTEVPLP